jgi:hypothetical protein
MSGWLALQIAKGTHYKISRHALSLLFERVSEVLCWLILKNRDSSGSA